MITIMQRQYTQEEVASMLLYPIWRGLDEAYKTRYKREIWEQFENQIRSSAYTSVLSKFLQNVKARLSVTIQMQHAADILKIVENKQDNEILNWLRNETTYLCLLVRLQNKERNDAYDLINEPLNEE